jgi:hypothetical protein
MRAAIACALALGCALGAATVRAQSLVLRPAAVPLKGQVGQSVTQVLTLNNESDQPLEFDVVAQDVVVRDGKRVFVEAGKLAGSIAATAVIEPHRVRVAPHSSSSATVIFTVPEGVRHRAAIALFKGTTAVQAGQRKAFLSLGTLFTFAVSDNVSVKGELRATPPTAKENASLAGVLANDGSEPVVATGVAVLVDEAGRMVGKSAFEPKRLLPGESAMLRAEYPGELEPGSYRAIGTFDIAGRPLTLTSPLLVP